MPTSRASEYYFLPDSAFTAEAKARTDIARSLAGRTRHEYELATGENPFPDESPASQLNPDARLGHNHSGPPWGSAFLHPVAWCGGKKATANIQGERQVATVVGNGGSGAVETWMIYVRPFVTLPSPFIAPYSRLYLHMIAHLATAGSADLAVVAGARPVGGSIHEFRTAHATVSSTSENAFAFVGGSHEDELYVDVVPGFNVVTVRFANTDPSAEDVVVDALSLCQIVKRSH